MLENKFQPSTPGLIDGSGFTLEQGREEMERRRKKEVIRAYLDVIIPGLCSVALAGGISLLDIGSRVKAIIQKDEISSFRGQPELSLEELQHLEDALKQTNIVLTPVGHWFVPESEQKKQDI
jgi:hypothetical protein